MNYPATLRIDYPETAPRLTVFFRILLSIPILIILGSLSYIGYGGDYGPDESLWLGVLVIPTLLMVVFRQKYPKWWFDWNVHLTKFSTRVFSYLFLLQHEYPSTDEEQGVNIEIQYPDVKNDLNQWLPLVKWFLAIPHVFVLCFIWIGVVISTIITWFIILFTGKNPSGLFNFVVGAMRWSLRVQAYALLLVTDQYPPFSLRE